MSIIEEMLKEFEAREHTADELEQAVGRMRRELLQRGGRYRHLLAGQRKNQIVVAAHLQYMSSVAALRREMEESSIEFDSEDLFSE